MPSLKSIGLFAIPLAFFGSVLYPKLEIIGAFRTVENHNNQNCRHVPGLEACEDAWIHEPTGQAYLVCSSQVDRKHWCPAMLHLDAEKLPQVSNDYIAILDLNTNEYRKLTINGLPADANGIWVHGIDVHEAPDSDALTIIINSHRPPQDRSTAPVSGADSVIEILETTLGSSTLEYVQTVRHAHVRTPNNIAAVGPRQFYFSNDHAHKVHWTRAAEALYDLPSDIVYCDASGSTPTCISAVAGLNYPNGVARGTNGMIYSTSSLAGDFRMFERQADNTLVLLDQVRIPVPFDNLHVDARTGAIHGAAFPKILKLIEATKSSGRDAVSPVEVYRVSNDTSDAKFYGGKYKTEKIFADDGQTVQGVTSAVPWRNKLLLTGVWTKQVTVCEI